ncbi:leukotriene B4 receptor 2b [Hoplias malabaricus]|uniref:leukotriene B4 receptor 2b n=1 Tax=Hoplias malabaricus TaxID=27720 RepID=UPI0034618DBC
MSLENSTIPQNPDSSHEVTFIIGSIILVVVFLLGVPGNLFIIWSIVARARKRSVTMLLILNLAMADGSIMCLTVFFLVYLARQSWVFGGAMCKLLFYLCNTNMYASILLITLMSLQRLVAVRWPHHIHSVTRRKYVLAVLIALWTLVFTLALPALIFREEKSKGQRTLCTQNHSQQKKYVVLQYTLETVLGFLLPYGIILCSYTCLLQWLRRRSSRRIHSERLILAIIITFGVFWLPYHIINIIQVVAVCSPENSYFRKNQEMWESIRVVTSALAFISSSANPVLYTFAGRSYIRADGLAFMARLFEKTVADINTKNCDPQRERPGLGLKNKSDNPNKSNTNSPTLTTSTLTVPE